MLVFIAHLDLVVFDLVVRTSAFGEADERNAETDDQSRTGKTFSSLVARPEKVNYCPNIVSVLQAICI